MCVDGWGAELAARGWELETLLRELRPRQPQRILEIGTHQGESLRIWRHELGPQELLLGIQDTDETSDETLSEARALLVRGKSQDVETFRKVLSVLEHLPDRKPWIDFLYIDGDHHYQAVKSDWLMYGPLVRSGGVIVLDDAVITDNETVAVYRLWREIAPLFQHKVIYSPGGTGMAIVEVP